EDGTRDFHVTEVQTCALPISEFIGGIMKPCENKRGTQLRMDYVTETKVIIEYMLPMNEIVMDFYDRLKSISKGYASMEYELLDRSEERRVGIEWRCRGAREQW